MRHHLWNALAAALAVAALAAGACSDAQPGDDGPAVAIDVAPLQLDGVDNARYALSVRNESGELVWTRTVDSDGFGDGLGAISYVGPCDAGDDPDSDGDATNTVELVVDALFADGELLTSGVDYVNPAPAGSPATREVVCRADADAAVGFELTIARRAQQGFFDVAVSFEDVFCSAKLDCVDDDGQPLNLLFDGTERDRTVVLGFACTAGLGADTRLYMDPVAIDCGAAGGVSLDPDAPAGNKGAVAPFVFQHALFLGEEQLTDGATSWSKVYWNLAIGVDEPALSATDPCVLTARATAAGSAFDGGTAPEGAVWPRVDWNVTLNSLGNSTLTCLSHGLDAPGSGVATTYGQGDVFRYELTPSGVPGQAPSIARVDLYASCSEIKAADPALTGLGVYTVDMGAGPVDVLCDMDTAGGGWTLITAQLEADPIAWDEGRQADYDPTLTSGASFALTGADLPTHDQVAFGRLAATGPGAWDTDIIDHLALVYDPAADYAEIPVTGLATGRDYHLDRHTSLYHHLHNPEDVTGSTAEWLDTLTLDQVDGRGFDWSFSPSALVVGYRGFGYRGRWEEGEDAAAWALWVRDSALTGDPSSPPALPVSCDAIATASPGLTGQSVHTIQPAGSDPVMVLCDFDSLGGGWTLVAAQFEATPVAWSSGRTASMEPNLRSGEGFALTGPHIPAHAEVAFGQILRTGAGAWTVDTLDRIPFTYTTGNIAKTLVAGASGTSYHIHRSASLYYASHNPEEGSGNLAHWNNTLTIDETGGHLYTFAFSPQHGTPSYRGYSFDGAQIYSSSQPQAWAVWVR